MKTLASLALLLPLFSFACVYENEPPRRLTSDIEPGGVQAGETPPPAASAPEATPPTGPAPMIVEVDADQTMSAVGGDGVGVFIEYRKGGHWQLTWTCDTTQTRQSCDFVIGASVASGGVANVDASGLPASAVSTPTASRVEARTRTTTELHTLKFDTAAGAILTVDASVGGLKDGAFLFFVQDGKVNGGFTGKLTNPLQLQGNTP